MSLRLPRKGRASEDNVNRETERRWKERRDKRSRENHRSTDLEMEERKTQEKETRGRKRELCFITLEAAAFLR